MPILFITDTVSDSNMSSGLLPVDGSAVDTIAITAGGHYIGFVTDWIQTIQYLQGKDHTFFCLFHIFIFIYSINSMRIFLAFPVYN